MAKQAVADVAYLVMRTYNKKKKHVGVHGHMKTIDNTITKTKFIYKFQSEDQCLFENFALMSLEDFNDLFHLFFLQLNSYMQLQGCFIKE